jgi:hypothetical protein
MVSVDAIVEHRTGKKVSQYPEIFIKRMIQICVNMLSVVLDCMVMTAFLLSPIAVTMLCLFFSLLPYLLNFLGCIALNLRLFGWAGLFLFLRLLADIALGSVGKPRD